MTYQVAIIGRGTYYREIIHRSRPSVNAGTPRMRPDYLVNWGLAGERWRDWERRTGIWRDWQRRIGISNDTGTQIVNRPPNKTKYSQLLLVRETGVPCPDTYHRITDCPENHQHSLLFKPYFSLGGRNITMAEDKPSDVDGYYQQFIPGEKRRYELRVHACRWIPEESYLIQKRVNDDTSAITWNHHTGGRFITVNEPREYRIFREAASYATRALESLDLDFGGVDFIVTRDGSILFLEVNMSIGFTMDRTRDYWVDCINRLSEEGYNKEPAPAPEPEPEPEPKQEWTVGEDHYDAVHHLINVADRFPGGEFLLNEEEREAIRFLDYWIGHA